MYQFFIDGVMLPIAPASMDTNINNKNTTITLLNGEEINIVKSAGLSDVSFTALLPNKNYPFSVYQNGSFQSAQYYLDLLERLKLSQKPFLFFVIRTDDSGNVVYTGKQRDATSKQTAKNYTVQKGDTLWNICKKELGDGSKYQQIAQKNGITTPNNIQVGQVIQLE